MTGDFERNRPRAEIDARARVSSAALERDARALGVGLRRRLALPETLANLWRQLTLRRARDQREA